MEEDGCVVQPGLREGTGRKSAGAKVERKTASQQPDCRAALKIKDHPGLTQVAHRASFADHSASLLKQRPLPFAKDQEAVGRGTESPALPRCHHLPAIFGQGEIQSGCEPRCHNFDLLPPEADLHQSAAGPKPGLKV